MLPPPNPDKNEQFQQRKPGRNFTSAYGIMSISTLYRDALQKYGKLVLDFEEHASPLAPTFQAHSVGIKDEYVNDQLNALHTQSSQSSVQSSRFGGCDDFSSSDESLSTQSSAPGPPKSRLCKAIESVFDGIRSLYRISALLKRPRNANKYLRSRNMIMPSQATLRTEEDHAHILEKMRQWRHLTMRSQFKYWEESPDIPETQEEDIVSRSNSKRVETKDLSATQTSFSSVAISALAETRTEAGRLRTEHTNSVVGGSNAIRVPDIPECSKTDSEFECPFCHLVLSSDRMQDRRAWKRHVFRDLRPYVCSFKSCLDPGRLFITRHDWIYHEQQMHRRKWICPEDCRETFRLKSAIIEHIHNDHFDGLEAHQISTFADMCEREIDVTESEQCLICLETMSLFRLQQHLATHMEEIALFVLPLPPQDDEAEGNYDDLNEESFLGSEDLPGQAETSYEEDQVLVSGTRHGRPEKDLGSLGEGSEVGQSSAAVILENGKPSHIYDETAEEIKKLEEEKARLQAESLINALKALQAEIKATADAANEKNKVVQAESDKIAALLADFEAKRLEREDRLMLKLPVGRELANIATTARETVEREATITVVIAEAENEKAFAEAKPRPDADKAPIMFTDAVDRKFTLPWHMAKTWKGMEALIKQAFVNIEHIGPHIANGHYHLLGPNNEIILPQVWEVAVQPGWDIKMQLWPLPEPTKDGNTSVSPGYEAPRKSHLERRTNPASSRPKSDSHQVTRKSNRLSASSHSAAVIGSEHLPYASQERRLLRSDRTYTESIWMGVHGRIPELLPNLIDLDPYDKPDIPAFCEPNNAEDQEEDAHQRLGLDT
ncbi:hypothetical protein D6D20_07837 [Aureobasidium pullulans]|uniref:C2H2-type domain-containing protein n=1 Tax=Aureobasidium pullulans TaxID=5580 RepID=A0A4S8Z099_AURPU|nr:hypothetical protein D6D20_07837 [Aureobasidium pullulans]